MSLNHAQIEFLEQVQRKAGRVGVLMGGAAGEREISLRSGAAVHRALCAADVDAELIDWDGTLNLAFDKLPFDRYFIALHGRGGEDGQIQAVLELLGLPYTGTRLLGCALAMDKQRSKLTWLGRNLPTPGFEMISPQCPPDGLAQQLGLPLMIKPAREGSSLGISKVTAADAIDTAIAHAASFDNDVLAEQFISGDEYTVSIVNGEVLPAIRLETPREFYDYDAKYHADDTRYICPCGLSASAEAEMAELVLKAFETLDGYGWGRVDLMRDAGGNNWLIELNTVPGMTDHSLVPMAAREAGWSDEQLVLSILASSFKPGELA